MNEDQVPRLHRFTSDHPDIEVRAPDYAAGALLWSARRDGVVLVAEYGLKALLDHLEQLPGGEGRMR